VYASDYWGDADLAACCDAHIAVLSSKPGSRQRQPIGKPLHEALVDNMLHLTEDEPELDHLFFGSGFDDYSDSLDALQSVGELVGNSSRLIKKARDRASIEKLLDGTPVRLPLSFRASKFSLSGTNIGFPLIFRPVVSGGGSGIRLMRSREELERQMSECEDLTRFLVQEYIDGLDLSCSVLSTGDEARALSVQGQLVGMPSAGLNCTFAYCGNYIPVRVPARTKAELEEISVMLSEELQLLGSNGFDFVVARDGRAVLMELNPRLQGSLEMLELSGNCSVTRLHLEATQGKLPKEEIGFRPTVKMIAYARHDFEVRGLSELPDCLDRTPDGSLVHRGDPVCTITKTGDSVSDCYRQAIGSASRAVEGIAQ
jgi:predicted ATP-grasp superfamily ATP-dependent carboligase